MKRTAEDDHIQVGRFGDPAEEREPIRF